MQASKATLLGRVSAAVLGVPFVPSVEGLPQAAFTNAAPPPLDIPPPLGNGVINGP